MKNRFDHILIGLSLGIVAPLIVLYAFYLKVFYYITFSHFIVKMSYLGLQTKIISLCVIANLLVFFIFIWTNKYKSANGIIMATFLYTFLVLGVKLLSE
jgi:hypothetical protein